MRKAVALLVLFLALLFANCYAVIPQDSLEIFAVTDDGKALSADLSLSLKPGTGIVWTRIGPLVGTSTQTTEQIAARIAEEYSGQSGKYDFFFEISSNASLVEGPSAGAAMALLATSMLQDREVPDDVSITGTITADGGIGPVGGVFEKSGEAARIGVKLFMVPAGEARQTVRVNGQVQSINLIDYAYQNWGMKILEVETIDDVLDYTFSDLESIDVNASAAVPDFVPSRLELNDNLSPMKALTSNYITEAEASIRSASVALSGSLLNEPEIVDSLLIYLNESEKTLERSKILFEQNYLYSSANFAFLAKVNSNFVKDIAEDPNIVSSTSTSLDRKAELLNDGIDLLASDLNRFVSVDRFEWQVASKERLAWARLKTKSILEKDELVIIIDQDGLNTQRFADLLDYEYALAWYEVSEDFFELTKDTQSAVFLDRGLAPKLDSVILNTKNSLSALSEEESEDIVRRLDSAKLAYESGWVYSALFDASSALALANSAIFSKNKGLDELQGSLDERIEVLEAEMSGSGRDYIWARLYLDHAKYFLDSSLFYEEQGRPGDALSSARSGIDLAFLAEGILDATESSYSHFESLPATSIVQQNLFPAESFPLENLVYTLVLAIALLAGLMLFAIASSGRKMHILKPFSFEDMLEDALKDQRVIRTRLERKQISESQFNALNTPLQDRINKLLLERRAVSADYVNLELNKSKVLAYERAIRELKQQLKKKNITAEDYASNLGFYRKKVALLKHLADEEERKIKKEKKTAKKGLGIPQKKK